MIKDESKFWREFKEDTPEISWTRVENSVSLGTPDLLGYNNHGYFFTVELKVSKSNNCLLYTSPSPRDRQKSRMPSSA